MGIGDLKITLKQDKHEPSEGEVTEKHDVVFFVLLQHRPGGPGECVKVLFGKADWPFAGPWEEAIVLDEGNGWTRKLQAVKQRDTPYQYATSFGPRGTTRRPKGPYGPNGSFVVVGSNDD